MFCLCNWVILDRQRSRYLTTVDYVLEIRLSDWVKADSRPSQGVSIVGQGRSLTLADHRHIG
jgi:hypothetical protein